MDEEPSFFRNPRVQIILAVVGGLLLYVYLTSRLGGAEKNADAIWLDCLFFYGGLAFTLFFISQFILPVRRLEERGKVFMRLLRYLTREHGQALFIESGEVIAHGGELKERGDGLAWLDAASAAILSNEVSFIRALGPGVSFTRRKMTLWWELELEQVVNPIDLHYRFVKVGPQPGEDPFADPKGMPAEEYDALQEKRWQTSGLTRDGIEIVPTITVFFKVGSPPDYKNPRFVYDEHAVFKAASGEGVNPQTGGTDSEQSVSWHRLPGLLAADIWRETLARFTLEDLFRVLKDKGYDGEAFWDKPPAEGGGRSTGLEFITRHIEETLTTDRARQLDAVGHVIYRTHRDQGKREIYALSQPFRRLQDRGVVVAKVTVDNLHLRKEVEEQIERRWESSWLDRSMAERELLDQEVSASREKNHHEALKEYADAILKQMASLPPGIPVNKTEVLKKMADGTLEVFMQNGLLRRKAPLDKNQLNELIEWLQRVP